MKIHVRSFIGAIAAILMLGLCPVVRGDELTEAISQLESAKADNHVEHLEKAKERLMEFGRKKHEHERADAIRSIDEAIEATRKSEKHRADEAIDRAIRQAREAH